MKNSHWKHTGLYDKKASMLSFKMTPTGQIRFISCLFIFAYCFIFGQPELIAQNKPIFALVTGDKIAVRDRPWVSENSRLIKRLKRGTKIELLYRTSTKFSFGKLNDYWYRYKSSPSWEERWVYGPYIKFSKEEFSKIPSTPFPITNTSRLRFRKHLSGPRDATSVEYLVKYMIDAKPDESMRDLKPPTGTMLSQWTKLIVESLKTHGIKESDFSDIINWDGQDANFEDITGFFADKAAWIAPPKARIFYGIVEGYPIATSATLQGVRFIIILTTSAEGKPSNIVRKFSGLISDDDRRRFVSTELVSNVDEDDDYEIIVKDVRVGKPFFVILDPRKSGFLEATTIRTEEPH